MMTPAMRVTERAATPTSTVVSCDASSVNGAAGGAARTVGPFPSALSLEPRSRNPLVLCDETTETVLDREIPDVRSVSDATSQSTGERGLARVSIVVLTHDNLVLNRLCLESVLWNTTHPDYEILIVDNGSRDGTREYVGELARQHAHVRVLLNERNRGFAAANNQAIAQATGDVLVLLNNDTIVPPHWLTALRRHLNDPAVGLVGPVTNRAGNWAQIPASYRTYGELLDFAARYTGAHPGQRTDVRTAHMFCVAIRRDVLERVGPLDERYGLGMFEDDDYAMAVRAAGYRVVCAEDVFVHHFGQGSLGALAERGEYGTLFHENRARFETKWGVAWESPTPRPDVAYDFMRARVQSVVAAEVPEGSRVLVVTRGDADLLNYPGRTACHFPHDERGQYAGHHPADSSTAIAQLREAKRRGCTHLLLPQSSFWWLEHYEELYTYLRDCSREVFRDEESCVLYSFADCEADGRAQNEG